MTLCQTSHTICETSHALTCIHSEIHVQLLRKLRVFTQKFTCIHSDLYDVQSLRSCVTISFPAKPRWRQVVMHLAFQVVGIHVAEKHKKSARFDRCFFRLRPRRTRKDYAEADQRATRGALEALHERRGCCANACIRHSVSQAKRADCPPFGNFTPSMSACKQEVHVQPLHKLGIYEYDLKPQKHRPIFVATIKLQLILLADSHGGRDAQCGQQWNRSRRESPFGSVRTSVLSNTRRARIWIRINAWSHVWHVQRSLTCGWRILVFL